MAVRTTIKNGDSIILNNILEYDRDSISIIYDGTTIITLSPGQSIKLDTIGRFARNYIRIGSKVLNTQLKYIKNYIECIVRYTWDSNPGTKEQLSSEFIWSEE